MKPIHLAVVLAVLAAGALLYLALDSDVTGRGGRSERTHDPTTARETRTPDPDVRTETAPAGDGALSFTLKIAMPDGTAATAADVELHGRARLRTTADKQGELRVSGLHPGLYNAAARKGGAVGVLDFELKEISDLGTLTLAEGVAISGHVYDSSGAPLEGALVEAVVAPRKKADMMQRAIELVRPDAVAGRALTGEDGAYALFLPRGRAYTMRVTAAGYGLETEPARTQFADVTGLDFRLFPAADLIGKVVNTAGAPVPGAHALVANMQAMMTGNARKAETTTNARGEFRLPWMPGGELLLVVSATGYARHIEQDASVTARGITIVLERGVTLRLRTVDDSEKKPAPGVHVLAVHHSSFATGVTGADGRLEIEHLAERASGPMRERQLWLPGGPYVPRMVDLSDKEPKDGLLDAGDIEVSRGGTVTGRVLDRGKDGIEGAVVRALPGGGIDRMMMSGSSTTSGPDGSFELSGVPLDAVGLIGVHPDYTMDKLMEMFAGEEDEAKPIFLDKSRTARRDVHMSPAGKIIGVVTGPGGQPVVGARLIANDEELFYGAMMGLLPPPPLSDAEGRFVFRGLRKSATFTLIATHRDYSPSKPVEVVAGKGGAVVLRLMKPALLHGRVVDDKGEPLPGVHVSGEPDRQKEDRMMIVVGPGVGGVRPTVTNDTGHYLLRNVPPGRCTIRFEHPQFVPASSVVSVAPGKTDQKVAEVRMRHGLTIAGIVVDESGKPLAGIHVYAEAPEVEGKSSATDVTGGEGRFSMGGFEADAAFRVDATGTGWFSENVLARPGNTDVRIVLVKPATLSGRVTWGGQPVRGATVSVYRRKSHGTAEASPHDTAEAAERLSRFNRSHVDSTDSGDDGAFVLKRVPPSGTFIVEVTHDGYRTKTLKDVRASTRSLHIRLDPDVRIAGIVVDQRNRPILAAQVHVRVNKGNTKRVQTDKHGRFEVGGLDDGSITVRVRESGLGLIKTEWMPVQPDDRSIRITATRGERITGRVLGTDGKPVRHVSVEALDAQGNTVAHDWVWTNSGKFTVKGLPAGTYRLKISGRKLEAPFFVEAVAAGTRDMQVTVR